MDGLGALAMPTDMSQVGVALLPSFLNIFFIILPSRVFLLY